MNTRINNHTSFLTDLANGIFSPEKVLPFPLKNKTEPESYQDFLKNLESLLINRQNITHTQEDILIKKNTLKEFSKIGAMSMLIPTEYRGMGLSLVDYNKAISLIGSYDISLAIAVAAHQSIGTPQPLIIFGSNEQKEKYLPLFSTGLISAFALTETNAGSDPSNISTTAKYSTNTNSYILNGQKLWITNGPLADVFVVIAKTIQEDQQETSKPIFSAFIVESSTKGFRVDQICDFMGIQGVSNGLITFNNLEVPKSNLIGEEGQGLKIALTVLNTGRLSIPSIACGACKTVLKHTKKWADKRIQGGKKISNHPVIKNKLLLMNSQLLAMESVLWLSTAIADQTSNYRLEAAIAKYFCTETAWKIADNCLQIRGGRGYEKDLSLSKREPVTFSTEQLLRDLRILRIIEGTSEIMEYFIFREILSNLNTNIIHKKNNHARKHYNNEYFNFIENNINRLHNLLTIKDFINKNNQEYSQELSPYISIIVCLLYTMIATCSYSDYLIETKASANALKDLTLIYLENTSIKIENLFNQINNLKDQKIMKTPLETIDDFINLI